MSKNINTYPKLGYYYHYKHDPRKDFFNYAYKLLNISHHTEIDGLFASAMATYMPLYPEAGVYKEGKHWDTRPMIARKNWWYYILALFGKEPSGFLDPVKKHGKVFERFIPITDEQIIAKLKEKERELYA